MTGVPGDVQRAQTFKQSHLASDNHTVCDDYNPKNHSINNQTDQGHPSISGALSNQFVFKNERMNETCESERYERYES